MRGPSPGSGPPWTSLDRSSAIIPPSMGSGPGGEIHILDVCTGGGIAGIAMASALVGEGKRVGITAVDAREDDLRLLEDWLRHAGLLGSVEFEAVVADAVDLPNVLRRRYNISLIWGSSMPHFDPWRAAKLMAGLRELGSEDSVLLVEQRDVATRLLLTNQFRRVLSPEGSVGEDGSAMLSVIVGHDPLRGTIRRAYYSLPGWSSSDSARITCGG